MTKLKNSTGVAIFLSLTTIATSFLTLHSAITTRFDVVVAPDGTGNYTTIGEAIRAVPDFSQTKFYIKIKAGVYHERIIIDGKKTSVVLVGDGMEKTVITGNRSHGQGFQTYYTATFVVYGNDFIAQDITFRNTATDSTQAVALLIESNHTAFFRCKIESYQDTLCPNHGTQFFRECYIYGTVDFIFGDATVVLQNCYIYGRTDSAQTVLTLTAQGRDTESGAGGTILHNCTLTTIPDSHPTTIKVYMGRPWRQYSRTVVMQSFLDGVIDPKGWLEWDGKPEYNSRVYYGEYGNRGPGANTSARVDWKGYRLLGTSEAYNFTVRNFLQGDIWIPSIGIPYDLDLIQIK